MLCTFDRAMKEYRAMDNPLGRRKEDRVASCITCGAVLGIFVEGEMPKLEAHSCVFVPLEGDWLEAQDMLAEMKATRGEEE